MSDVTVNPESLEEEEDTLEEIETTDRKSRYTGPVNMAFAGEEADVDLETLPGKGRQPVDLVPYKAVLADNFKKNERRPDNKKRAWYTTLTPIEALGVVKSRFNSAGAELNIGIRWIVPEDPVLDPNTGAVVRPSAYDYENDTVRVGLVTGKRAENRGRKPSPK